MVLNPRDELVQLAALLTQLVALAQAVEQLRHAQERQAQASAARLAAERLLARQQRLVGLTPAEQAARFTSRPWDVSSPRATPTDYSPAPELLVPGVQARAGPTRR